MVDNLLSRIEELKRRKRAVILAHYYTLPEVQSVADFLGDSLALSIEAKKVEACSCCCLLSTSTFIIIF